jgi:hypothetical protein
VTKPETPTVLYGLEIGQLRAFHDDLVGRTRSETSAGFRSIRQDQKTLMTVILSHPIACDDLKNNAEKQEEVKKWQEMSINFLKEKYGDQLKSVILHEDESHPHLHCYLISSDGQLKANHLHPGDLAKRQVFSEELAKSQDTKTANKMGDRAYKEAMRKWQDDYYEKVGIFCGLSRIGPGNRRLSREEWQAEKSQSKTTAKLLEKAEEAQKDIEIGYRAKAFSEKAKINANQYVNDAKAFAEKIKMKADEKKREAEKDAKIARANLKNSQKIGLKIGVFFTNIFGVRSKLEKEKEKKIAEIQKNARDKIEEEKKRIEKNTLKKFDSKIADLESALKISENEKNYIENKANSTQKDYAILSRNYQKIQQALAKAEAEKAEFQKKWAIADNEVLAMKRGNRL